MTHQKTLSDKTTVDEVSERINSLTSQTQGRWGKMSVNQMLKHCSETFEAALGKKEVTKNFLSYTIGPMLKFLFTNETPLSKGSPTAKEFIIIDNPDFETEKTRLINLIQEYHNKFDPNSPKTRHAFFGKLTPNQWARGMYKHTDHHLTQFGV